MRRGTSWSQQAYLKASNTGEYDIFGSLVAVSGDVVVVGACREGSNATGVNGNQSNNSAQWAGAAYVFTGLGPTPSPDQDADGLPDFAEAYFGTSPTVPNGSPTSVDLISGQVTLLWPEAAPTGVIVTPQWSPDLLTWLASGESANGIPARTLTVTTPAAGQKQATLDTTGLPRASLRLKLTQR